MEIGGRTMDEMTKILESRLADKEKAEDRGERSLSLLLPFAKCLFTSIC